MCFFIQGADPNCVNKEGKPVLQVAVLNKHADAVPILIQEGADVNKKGPNNGNTALHEAISLGPAGLPVIDALLGYCNIDIIINMHCITVSFVSI